MGHLENEIEKLSIQIGERKKIQEKDLEKYSGWKKKENSGNFFWHLVRKITVRVFF